MVSRTGYNHRKMMFYLTFFFFVAAASQTEFPCTFPCDWINKTFSMHYYSPVVGHALLTTWTFNADGTTGTLFSKGIQCFQISEQFLVVRVDDARTDVFKLWCFPVFYTLGQSNFTLHYKDQRFVSDESVERVILNQMGALNESQLCDICGPRMYDSPYTLLALEQPTPAPNVIPPAVCDVPFNCQSDSGIACPQGGGIPKECTGKDTTTTDKTTTTTADYLNTTRPKKPCGRRGRFHRHGQ